MDDKGILKLFEERSEQALTEALHSYRGLMYGVAFGILRSPEDAEECVNDALLAAWESIPPLPDSLPAYLSKLTRNIAISACRKRTAAKRGGGQVPLIIDELSECIPDARSGKDPCSDIVLRDALKRFVACLNGSVRRVFVLRYWYSFSVEEIARECGVSCGSVKMKLVRARKRLKKQLAKEGIIV